jgi:hypothetical protein
VRQVRSLTWAFATHSTKSTTSNLRNLGLRSKLGCAIKTVSLLRRLDLEVTMYKLSKTMFAAIAAVVGWNAADAVRNQHGDVVGAENANKVAPQVEQSTASAGSKSSSSSSEKRLAGDPKPWPN